jgi:MFS family permease
MWKVLPSHIWAAICMTGFGIVATLQSAIYSFTGMMVARFFPIIFEAGFGPAFPLYLSYFYLRHEIGFRLGLIISTAPLATCFTGALAYGIASGDGSKIANLRLLFLVEGLPSIIAGLITFFTLPDSPTCVFPTRRRQARSSSVRSSTSR